MSCDLTRFNSGSATYLWVGQTSAGGTHFPKLLPPAAELSATEGDDGVRATQAQAYT